MTDQTVPGDQEDDMNAKPRPEGYTPLPGCFRCGGIPCGRICDAPIEYEAWLKEQVGISDGNPIPNEEFF